MPSDFNPEEFVGNPTALKLKSKKVTKDQLKTVALDFGINFPCDIRKDALISLVLAHLGKVEQTSEIQESSHQDLGLALEIKK